ncbi:hypothetical protein ZIOFF_051551 [Zingiber officinale]|uniref:Polyprotein n=1 Tax=Zingiber officinale TaxID=94328 RepID=A0A8J5FRG7_ZINOF|nr:hypothetical protein ZIOFF_051551 [Zingiber officinale]
MVVDAFNTDEVIVAADVEHVTPLATTIVTMPRASSLSTPPSNAHAVTSPLVTNTPEFHEGPTRFKSIVDIYANTKEVVGVDEEENEVMMVATKRLQPRLTGTIHFGLVYMKRSQEIGIFGYSDNDLAVDLDGSKSTSGMTFYFNESLVSWNSQKQKIVTLSSCEAEFMVATTAACHASELTGVEPKPVTLFVDNKSAIALMKNPVFHGRNKHIDTRFHFIRECIEKGQIVVEFVNTGE